MDLSRASPGHPALETARSGSLVASWSYEAITFKTDFLSPMISVVHAIASLFSYLRFFSHWSFETFMPP